MFYEYQKNMAEHLQQTISTLQQTCATQTDPKVINAIQSTINYIRNSQKIRTSFGNLSPNVNSANDNTVTSTNVGEASASYQSPASDNAVNTAEIDNCAANVSPFYYLQIIWLVQNLQKLSSNFKGNTWNLRSCI